MTGSDSHTTANADKWSRRSATYDDKRFGYFRLMQRELIRSVGLKVPCSLLDLGCGTGWAVLYASKLLEGRGRFVGVDLSSGMIEKAKSNAAGSPSVEFYAASATALPFDDGSFDTILCSNSFHHYLPPEAALAQVKRVLRPGGRIHILDVTADDFLIRWIDRLVKARENEHVRFYSTKEYADLFARSGLAHIKSQRVGILYPLKIHVAEKAVVASA